MSTVKLKLLYTIGEIYSSLWGGALKPEKCFYTLIGYVGLNNGGWRYRDYSKDEQYQMTVPAEDGTLREISHKPVTEAQKTLGIFTCPDGSPLAQLKYMQRQAQGWIDRMLLGTLPKQLVWLSLTTQFWPRVGYGIDCNSASFAELTEALRKPYFKILPLCGINRHIRTDFCQLPAGFFGVGLPHPGIEATIASLNLLTQHFGAKPFWAINSRHPTSRAGIVCQSSPRKLQEILFPLHTLMDTGNLGPMLAV